MPDIVLATLNARYPHSAFGLRYLYANLGDLRDRARILEFDISQRPLDIVEVILREDPRLVGLGVYIWNVSQTTQVVADLKRIRPDVLVVLGGPEVSYETDQQPIARLADYVIVGEADLAFAALCRQLLLNPKPETRDSKPSVLNAPPPDLATIAAPYPYYTDADLAQRVVYVEASRGCPFGCEFCLSALDIPVRQFPLEPFLAEMRRLLDRGLRQFKFVDRTFNLSPAASQAILRFFLERLEGGATDKRSLRSLSVSGPLTMPAQDTDKLRGLRLSVAPDAASPPLFLHFEMVPDRLPEALRELIVEFPSGVLQFEVGIQTFNEEVAARIGRRQDNAKAEANLRWLREHTGVHVHADLIVGLPGEGLGSFAAGFDRLVALGPQEIQVGMLKRLRGAPIARHDAEWGMIYSPNPPYEILANRLIDFSTMQRLRRFARYWDLVANSGNFIAATPLLWRSQGGDAGGKSGGSPFAGFLAFSDWLFERVGQTHGVALSRLLELVFDYLTQVRHLDRAEAAATLAEDYRRSGHSDRLPFLAAPAAPLTPRPAPRARRQARHRGAEPT